MSNFSARQFQDVFPSVLVQRSTVNFASAADAGFASVDVTVTGAALGDIVLVALGVDTVDLGLTGAVTAANTVTLTVQNDTGGAVDLASTTATIVVLKVKQT